MDKIWLSKFLVVAVFCTRLVATARDVNNVNDRRKNESGGLGFTPCHYNDPSVNECIRSAAEEAKMLLAHGIPSLGIQSLEPLKIPSVRLRQHNGPKNGFKYDAWLSDVMLKGLTDYSFNNLDVYPEDLKITGNLSLPNIYMTSDFLIIGEFQMLPVEATGMMMGNFTNCSASIMAQGAKVHDSRMVVRDSDVTLECSGPFATSIEEANTGKGEMAKMADHIVEMHSDELIKAIKPAVETSLSMVLEDIANKFLKYIPLEEVFPK